MKSWTLTLTLSAALAGGCAAHNSESANSGALPANCIEPITFGSAECAKGMSILTRQSVASDRCVETFLFRDTRQGSLKREVLC